MTVALDVGRYEAVVFDMDGVITDTASVHEAAWKRMFDDYSRERAASHREVFRAFTHEDYLRYVDGRPRDDGVDAFLQSRAIVLSRGSADDAPDAKTVWGLANRKNRDFLAVIAENGVKVFASSVSLVRALQAHGVGTAVISASRNCRHILRAGGIEHLFPVRVDGLELERLSLPGKPAPAMFLEAARRLNATAARSVVVEDAIAGVDAAKRGEFALVIGVDRGGDGEKLRAHGADVVVPDLANVEVVHPTTSPRERA